MGKNRVEEKLNDMVEMIAFEEDEEFKLFEE